jgi:hypothetical protein
VSIEGKRYWMDPQTNPLRTVGGLFLDPRGKEAQGGWFQTCTANGESSTSDGLCCSGSRSQKGTCAPTPCERGGDGICTETSAACASIGGRSSSTSCGVSVDGSVCCALPFAH